MHRCSHRVCPATSGLPGRQRSFQPQRMEHQNPRCVRCIEWRTLAAPESTSHFPPIDLLLAGWRRRLLTAAAQVTRPPENLVQLRAQHTSGLGWSCLTPAALVLMTTQQALILGSGPLNSRTQHNSNQSRQHSIELRLLQASSL